jgi:PAS domain S-box-containing protein
VTGTLPQFAASTSAVGVAGPAVGVRFPVRPMWEEFCCLVDSTGVLYHLGDAAAYHFGKSAAQLIGRPLVDVLPVGEPDAVHGFLTAVFQKTAAARELRLNWSSETFSGKAVLLSDGLVAGTRPVLAMLRLRLPREAEPTARTTTCSQDDLLSMLRTAVFQLDEAGRISYINEAWEEFSGFSAAESIDKSLLEFIDHADAPAFVEEFERLVEGERPVMRMDLRLLRANGGVTWCEFHARRDVRVSREAGIAVYGSLNDITARKLLKDDREHYIADLQEAREQAERQAASLTHLAQQLMAARDEAMKAIDAKTQFLANMSHEIRTPMNGMVGMLGMLLETELQKDQREYAEIARNSGVALMEILSEILDYSKIESRTLELEVERFHLYQLLDELVESYAERAELKGIELFCQFDQDVPADVVGDVQRLRQVLNHLLSNALKFTSEGQIQVFVALIEEDGRTAKLHFEIADSGVGISADRQPHIFKPFYQVDESNSRKFGGTGLGLAICQELVGLMGGQIGVNSDPGEGSTFWFTAEFGLPPVEAVRDDVSKLQGRSMFVYATNPHLRSALCRQMGSWGIQVQTPTDPSEAMRALLRKPTSGPAVRVLVAEAEALAAAPEGTVAGLNRLTSNVEIRLILVAPYHHSGYRAVLKDLMVSDVLTKPLRSNLLQTAVLKAVREYTPNLPLEESLEAAQLAQAPREAEIDSRGRILISQTDWVHQRLTIYLLSSLGYRGEIASTEDYCESLMRSRRYSVLLLDVENPKFDAIGFVRRLRKQESGKLHRTSVVAMVRNMSARLEETMREAGVDEFVLLPMQAQRLRQVLLQHCLPEPDATSASAASSTEAAIPVPMTTDGPEPALDPKVIATFEKLTQGSAVNIYSHMVWPAMDDAELRLQSIRDALQAGDTNLVYNEAHTIKGSSGYVGATKLQQISAALEKSAKEGTLVREEADAQVEAMAAELQRIVQALLAEGHSKPEA